MLASLLQQLLRSRAGLLGTAGGVVGLGSAAVVRLIPWGLFFLLLLLAVVGVIAFVYVRAWWAKRKDESFAAAMDAQGQKAKGQARVRDRAQIDALQTQWKTQFAALQKSKIGRQRRFVYFLPWYAIIGAPACGKSTAIANSGLRFPMGQPKLGGTGGTKNCDWWFSEECILLDTAGRYTFNDDNEPDRDEWLEFLKLLKKYRPVAPINGLIVAVAADELLGRDENDRLESARAIRHKLEQLVRELGIQFPVYLLITKCDLIEGFTEFFGRLPQRRLGEMLGWTNPSWDMGDPRKLVGDAMAELRDRFARMRPAFLWEAERAEQLRDVYLFPEEARALEEALTEFCDVVFRETQYNEAPFLRGIYLTSGLQKGTAVSSMLKRLGLRAQAIELPEQKRSFFLRDFFGTRLPADKNLVATTGRTRGHTQVVHNVALALVATAAVLVAVVTGGSYVANRTLLNRLEDQMRAAKGAEDRPPAETLDALAKYVSVLEELEERNRRRPLAAGWGLWTGGTVIEPARRLFLERFERDGYRPAIDRARRDLRDRDDLRAFPALEAVVRDYVLTRLVEKGSRVPGANDALAAFWPADGAMPVESVESFGQGYLAYLHWRSPQVTNAEKTENLTLLRTAVPEMFTVDQVAKWAERVDCPGEGGPQPCYPPLRARDVPVPAVVADGAEVRGAFRPEAWNGHVAPLVGAIEELGSEIDPQILPDFRQQFADARLEAWRAFLMRPKVVGDRDVPIATQLAEQTPYLAVVDRVAAALGADVDGRPRPAWAETVVRVDASRADYLAQLAGVLRHVRNSRQDPAAALDDARAIFQRRTPVVTEPDAEPPADAFGKAERWIQTLVHKGPPADGDDAQVRVRLEELLAAPVYEGFGVYLDSVAQAIDQQWRNRIGTLRADNCQDVAALYARPGGAVPEFVTAVMEPFFEMGSFQPKVRYRHKLPRTLAWLPPKEAQARRSCGGGAGGGGGGGGPCNVFFRSVPTGATPDGLFATYTVLRVFCGAGEPLELVHRNYPVSMNLIWSPETCSRAEVSVSVGSRPDEVRPLEPRSAPSLPALITEAEERGGGRVGWRFGGGVKAIFELSEQPPGCLFRSTAGLGPPVQLPRP